MALDLNINTLEKAKFVEFGGETCLRVFVVNPSSGGSNVKNYGRESIINGQDYATIVFTVAMLTTTYTALISIETDDGDPIFLSHIVKNKTVNGMTIQLNAPVNNSSYYIDWAVVENGS